MRWVTSMSSNQPPFGGTATPTRVALGVIPVRGALSYRCFSAIFCSNSSRRILLLVFLEPLGLFALVHALRHAPLGEVVGKDTRFKFEGPRFDTLGGAAELLGGVAEVQHGEGSKVLHVPLLGVCVGHGVVQDVPSVVPRRLRLHLQLLYLLLVLLPHHSPSSAVKTDGSSCTLNPWMTQSTNSRVNTVNPSWRSAEVTSAMKWSEMGSVGPV